MYTNIIDTALDMIRESAITSNLTVDNSNVLKQYCQLELAPLEYEVFSVLYLNNSNRLIEFNKMFRGTLDCCSVYPRDVVKRALEVNAKSVVLAHNHPGGKLEPSTQDRAITNKLINCLSLFDINVLDHIIVTKKGTYSFAEHSIL